MLRLLAVGYTNPQIGDALDISRKTASHHVSSVLTIDQRLEPGDRPRVVRATDGRGDTQDADRTPPHPSGATGQHRIVVAVTDD